MKCVRLWLCLVNGVLWSSQTVFDSSSDLLTVRETQSSMLLSVFLSSISFCLPTIKRCNQWAFSEHLPKYFTSYITPTYSVYDPIRRNSNEFRLPWSNIYLIYHNLYADVQYMQHMCHCDLLCTLHYCFFGAQPVLLRYACDTAVRL